jgi:hypothetical protein
LDRVDYGLTRGQVQQSKEKRLLGMPMRRSACAQEGGACGLLGGVSRLLLGLMVVMMMVGILRPVVAILVNPMVMVPMVGLGVAEMNVRPVAADVVVNDHGGPWREGDEQE